MPMSIEDQEAQACDLPKATASNTDTHIRHWPPFERAGSSSILLWPRPKSCAANGRDATFGVGLPQASPLGKGEPVSPGRGPQHCARGIWHVFLEHQVYLEIYLGGKRNM